MINTIHSLWIIYKVVFVQSGSCKVVGSVMRDGRTIQKIVMLSPKFGPNELIYMNISKWHLKKQRKLRRI